MDFEALWGRGRKPRRRQGTKADTKSWRREIVGDGMGHPFPRWALSEGRIRPPGGLPKRGLWW
jgi:hypothetical protein